MQKIKIKYLLFIIFDIIIKTIFNVYNNDLPNPIFYSINGDFEYHL